MSIWVYLTILYILFKSFCKLAKSINRILYFCRHLSIIFIGIWAKYCTKDYKNPTLLVLWWPTTQNDAKWRLKRCDDNFRQYLCFQYNFFCRSKYKNLLLCVGLFNAMVLYCFIKLVKISGMSYFNRICYTYCYEEYIQHVIFCSICFHDDAMNNSYTYTAISSKIYI